MYGLGADDTIRVRRSERERVMGEKRDGRKLQRRRKMSLGRRGAVAAVYHVLVDHEGVVPLGELKRLRRPITMNVGDRSGRSG
jgi:hypothetical protein